MHTRRILKAGSPSGGRKTGHLSRATFSGKELVPGEGFEPPTFGLQNRCTAAVLTRRCRSVNRRILRPGAEGERRSPHADRARRRIPAATGEYVHIAATWRSSSPTASLPPPRILPPTSSCNGRSPRPNRPALTDPPDRSAAPAAAVQFSSGHSAGWPDGGRGDRRADVAHPRSLGDLIVVPPATPRALSLFRNSRSAACRPVDPSVACPCATATDPWPGSPVATDCLCRYASGDGWLMTLARSTSPKLSKFPEPLWGLSANGSSGPVWRGTGRMRPSGG